jgi:serine/threonine-protein kinase
MLAGRKPFVASEPIDIIKKQIEEKAPRLADVTPGDYGTLETVVARALAKEPEDRYPSAVAMAEALNAALTTHAAPDTTARLGAASTREMPVARPEAPPRRTGRLLWLLLAIAALAGAAVYAYPLIRREFSGDPPPRDAAVAVTPAPDAAIARTISVDAALPVTADAAVVVDATVDTVDATDTTDAAPPATPADAIVARARQLAADGKLALAVDQLRHAREIYPESAQLPLLAGKLDMSRMYFIDGIASFRAALKIEASLRDDPELVQAALRAFTMTPSWNPDIAQFVIELGPSAKAALDDLAKTHANPAIRERAAALRARM